MDNDGKICSLVVFIVCQHCVILYYDVTIVYGYNKIGIMVLVEWIRYDGLSGATWDGMTVI